MNIKPCESCLQPTENRPKPYNGPICENCFRETLANGWFGKMKDGNNDDIKVPEWLDLEGKIEIYSLYDEDLYLAMSAQGTKYVSKRRFIKMRKYMEENRERIFSHDEFEERYPDIESEATEYNSQCVRQGRTSQFQPGQCTLTSGSENEV